MNRKSDIVAKRLTQLRESIGLSQAKLASNFDDVGQSAIFRYENAQSFPPFSVLIQYADYFDCSLDYIFGRTDKPQGKLYECKPPINPDNEELKEFIEMCFDPTSAASEKLKAALYKLMEDKNNG